jgi:hypothetical protein
MFQHSFTRGLAIITAAALSACTMGNETNPGTVVKFNGDTVTIAGGFTMHGDPAPAGVQRTAERICKGDASYESSRSIPGGMGEAYYFFVCMGAAE